MAKPASNVYLGAGICVAALVAIAAGSAMSLLAGGTIYPGVRMADVDLSGLSVEQARSSLAPQGGELSQVSLVLRAADRRWAARIVELGGRVDPAACARAAFRVGRRGSVFQRLAEIISVRRRGASVPAVYTFDAGVLCSYLERAAKRVNRAPVNARVLLDEGSIRVSSEKPGLRLDVRGSVSRIAGVVNSGGREVELTTEIVPPRIAAADFEGIDGVIASYSTSYNPWERSRTHNLKIACKAIDGALVEPGEVFGYNAAVGPRLKKYGFRDAPMFVRGEVEPGTGGGVCQVSTTLYNAALLADLRIRERTNHSRPVVYAPMGRDATVAYGCVDLKLENTTGSPICISAVAENKTVVVRIFGKRKPDHEVELISADHTVIPARVLEHVDESLNPGERLIRKAGRAGYRVSVYRVVKDNNVVVRRELVSKSYYPPEGSVVGVGPSPQ